MPDLRFSFGWTRTTRIVLGLLILSLAAGVVSRTWAAFSGSTANSANGFAAGTVTLSDNDSGGAMIALSNAKPYDTVTACTVVTYAGTLPSNVRLYGTTTGSGLDPYLNLTVTRGTIGSPTFPSCTGFAADAVDYAGAGYGVVYSGTLQGFPDSYAAGLVDPTSGAPESWTTSEAHAYRFVVTVQDNEVIAGLTATQTFTWEARNS